MQKSFGEYADEFVASVKAADIGPPNTEVNVVYYCIDQNDDPIPPFRLSLVPTTTVKGASSGWAQSFAEAMHVDTIIGNINSLIRPGTPERFSIPDEVPHIPMRPLRLELEILDVTT